MIHRLPRRIKIGHYRVDIVLVSQAVLREELDDDEPGMLYNGCWSPDLEHDHTHGRIFILQTLTLKDKWRTLWHELNHAITDLSGWDDEIRRLP